MENPTHYVVIKSPFAQQILNGAKKFEYRPESSARALANKTLAIAVAKSPRTPESGMIIGQVTFGRPAQRQNSMAIPVKEFELWPEAKWLPSPGGLGVRPIPMDNRRLALLGRHAPLTEETSCTASVGEGACGEQQCAEEADKSSMEEEEQESSPDEQPLQELAYIGVTQEQKEQIEELAEISGLPVGDYLSKAMRTMAWILREWPQQIG